MEKFAACIYCLLSYVNLTFIVITTLLAFFVKKKQKSVKNYYNFSSHAF